MNRYIHTIILIILSLEPALSEGQVKSNDTLINDFRKGARDYDHMPQMIKYAEEKQLKKLADSIASVYINSYQDTLSDQALLPKSYRFVLMESGSADMLTSRNKLFWACYMSPIKVDSIVSRKGIADGVVNSIIIKEEIIPIILQGGKPSPKTPDWKKIENHIRSKYTRDKAYRSVLDAKLVWYDEKKDWKALIKYYTEKVEKYGVDTSGFGKLTTNNILWEIYFKHCNQKRILRKAIKWEELVMQSEPGSWEDIDTYANLLYKTGNVADALIWEKKALDLSKGSKEITENYSKMKEGLPTWN